MLYFYKIQKTLSYLSAAANAVANLSCFCCLGHLTVTPWQPSEPPENSLKTLQKDIEINRLQPPSYRSWIKDLAGYSNQPASWWVTDVTGTVLVANLATKWDFGFRGWLVKPVAIALSLDKNKLATSSCLSHQVDDQRIETVVADCFLMHILLFIFWSNTYSPTYLWIVHGKSMNPVPPSLSPLVVFALQFKGGAPLSLAPCLPGGAPLH